MTVSPQNIRDFGPVETVLPIWSEYLIEAGQECVTGGWFGKRKSLREEYPAWLYGFKLQQDGELVKDEKPMKSYVARIERYKNSGVVVQWLQRMTSDIELEYRAYRYYQDYEAFCQCSVKLVGSERKRLLLAVRETQAVGLLREDKVARTLETLIPMPTRSRWQTLRFRLRLWWTINIGLKRRGDAMKLTMADAEKEVSEWAGKTYRDDQKTLRSAFNAHSATYEGCQVLLLALAASRKKKYEVLIEKLCKGMALGVEQREVIKQRFFGYEYFVKFEQSFNAAAGGIAMRSSEKGLAFALRLRLFIESLDNHYSALVPKVSDEEKFKPKLAGNSMARNGHELMTRGLTFLQELEADINYRLAGLRARYQSKLSLVLLTQAEGNVVKKQYEGDESRYRVIADLMCEEQLRLNREIQAVLEEIRSEFRARYRKSIFYFHPDKYEQKGQALRALAEELFKRVEAMKEGVEWRLDVCQQYPALVMGEKSQVTLLGDEAFKRACAQAKRDYAQEQNVWTQVMDAVREEWRERSQDILSDGVTVFQQTHKEEITQELEARKRRAEETAQLRLELRLQAEAFQRQLEKQAEESRRQIEKQAEEIRYLKERLDKRDATSRNEATAVSSSSSSISSISVTPGTSGFSYATSDGATMWGPAASESKGVPQPNTSMRSSTPTPSN